MNMREIIKTMLDRIWNAGETPQIMVDARTSDVIVPEYVRQKWGSKLQLGLLASYPMNLTTEEDALRADLAFNQNVVRCVFPWNRIYGIVNLDTQRVFLIRANVPEDWAPPEDASFKPFRNKFSVDERSTEDVLRELPPAPVPKFIKGVQGIMRTAEGTVLPILPPRMPGADPPTRKFKVIKGGKS